MICPFMSNRTTNKNVIITSKAYCVKKQCALWCVEGVDTGYCAFKKIAINTIPTQPKMEKSL